MGRPSTLTKQWLLDHNVVNVTKDGVVTIMSRQGEPYDLKPVINKKNSRFDDQQYRLVGIYDNETYEHQKKCCKTAPGTRMLVLSRVIWAWYNDVCPGGMDIDHINDDSLDDRLDNYQLLTRAENLAKRRGHMNQYEKSFKE